MGLLIVSTLRSTCISYHGMSHSQRTSILDAGAAGSEKTAWRRTRSGPCAQENAIQAANKTEPKPPKDGRRAPALLIYGYPVTRYCSLETSSPALEFTP